MVTCLADRASTKTCTLQQKGSGVQKAIYRRERKSLYFDFFKWKPWYWSVTCDCITVILRDSGCQSLSCWKHIACWAYKYPFYFPRKGGKAHLKKSSDTVSNRNHAIQFLRPQQQFRKLDLLKIRYFQYYLLSLTLQNSLPIKLHFYHRAGYLLLFQSSRS